MRETEELVRLDREIERLLRRRLELVAGPESGSTGYDQCRRAMEADRCPVSQPRVVYQGVAGAYSEMAALTFFGKEARCQGLARFEDVFEAVHRGEADYAVLPIENSSTGAIRQVYELLTQYQHYIVGEDTVRVEHCLMAPRGASLDTITQIYSHEQGLFQSDRFLSRHPEWEQIPFGDTAGSAQYVAQTGDITKAAIGSARAAELYGLDILYRGTNHNSGNTTRFVVTSPVMELRPGADKIAVLLSVPHQVGSLQRILTVFLLHGLNLMKIESRPMPDKRWEYLFFMEFSGSLTGPGMEEALEELSRSTSYLRVLGNFKNSLTEG